VNINVHIERLILDGIPVTHGEGADVQVALETELVRLLTEKGLGGTAGGAISSISGDPIRLTDTSKASNIGNQVAGAIYASIQPATKMQARDSFSGGGKR